MTEDKKDNSYRPYLSKNKEYLKKVAASIKGKMPLEDIPFYLLNEVLNPLGISEDPYQLLDPEDLKMDAVQAIADKAFDIINQGVTDEVKGKLIALWDYLCESDTLQKSDLIFVFGGGGETRPKEAAKLYKEGWAPKILFTGRGGSYMKEIDISEAEKFADIAIGEGVPTKDIILEKESINTIENVKKSLALLRQMDVLPKQIILVTLCYQMRRVFLTFRTVSNDEFRIIRYSAPSGRFKRENYFMSKDGWSYVFNEFIKLYGARLMKHF